jgi:hypothetical protein
VRDTAKDELNRLHSELSEYYRQKLGEEEGRVTEKQIANTVEASSQYTEAREKYKRAGAKVAMWEALEEAWKQRGFMVRELVKLYCFSYYGTDSIEQDDNMQQLKEARRKRVKGE